MNIGNPVGRVERFFRNLPCPYLVSALVAVTVLLIYWMAAVSGVFTPSGTRSWNWIMTQPLLMLLEFAGLSFFFGKIRYLFDEGLEDLYPREEITALREAWEAWFYNPLNIIQIAILLFVTSILFTITHPSGIVYANPGYSVAGLLFSAFNAVYYIFKIILLALIILILVNLVLLIHRMNGVPFRNRIRLNLLAADPFDALKPVQNLFLDLVAFYFVCITLENINSFSSSTAYPAGGIWVFDLIGVFFFISLIIAGLALLMSGTAGIRNIVRGRIEEKITGFYRIYERLEQELLTLIGKEGTGADTITAIQAKLDALVKQRETMAARYSQSKGITLPSLVEVGSAFLLSVITFITQITDFLAKYGIKLFG